MDIFKLEELLMKQFNVIDDLDTILNATDEDFSDDANVDMLMNMIIGVRAITAARISETMDAFDAFAGDYHRCAKDRDECVSKLQNDEFITENCNEVDTSTPFTSEHKNLPPFTPTSLSDRFKQAVESCRTCTEIKHNTDALNSSTVADFIDAEEDESDEDISWYNDFRKNRGNR